MNRCFLFIFIVILLPAATLAVSVSYDVVINGYLGEMPYSDVKNEVKDCNDICSYSVPSFLFPLNFTFSNYTVSNSSELIESISFASTGTFFSDLYNDTINLRINELKEELRIGELLTKKLNLGQNNIVVQVENIGAKDIHNIFVQISGDGVRTISKSFVNLSGGQTDFVTTIVSITNYGEIDIIIKAYGQDKLFGQTIETIFVNAPLDDKTKEEKLFVDKEYAQSGVDHLWKTLGEYEKDYLLKLSQEYTIGDISGAIDDTKDEILRLQSTSLKLTKDEFDQEVDLIRRNLEDIKSQIDLAVPKKFSTTLKENLGIIATTIGVIVSTLTAFGLAKTHVLSRNKNEKKHKK